MNEIMLYGPIGFDFFEPDNSVTARSVINQLSEIDGDVTVRISSGGGDVFEGIDIMTALKNYDGYVTVVVESLAASAASFIAVGGADKLLMRQTSELMIHRAWTFADGNADEVRKTLDGLERQDTKLANIYAGKAGGSVDDWLDAMSKESWYSADEAVDAGLADGMVEQPAPTEARNVPSFSASRKQFKYRDRSAAPPPLMPGRRSASASTNNKPSDGRIGDKVNILNQLAQELGKEPDQVRNALSGFFNEKVTVSGEVDVTYPADTPIVPTEKLTVDPIIGDAPSEGEDPSEGGEPAGGSAPAQNAVGDGGAAAGLGLTFEVGDAPEGWDASVDAESGTVTVKAPSGAEVGSTVEIPVTVNGTEVPLSLKVRGLSEEEEPAGGEDPAGEPSPTNSVVPKGMSLVPTDHLNYLNTLATNFGEQQAKLDAKANHDRVDKDIKDGRFSVANRAKALAVLQSNPQLYEDSWGNMRKGTINRGESGYTRAEVTDAGDASANVPSIDELKQRAAGRGNKKGIK